MNSEQVATRSILVVDDDVELLKALTKVLKSEGYSVTAKPDALSAIACIQSADNEFDLVITDVSMPGMKGTTLLSALKTAYPEIPVIVITAFGDWEVYSHSLREGAFEFLSKPLDKSELLACVHRAISSKGME